MKSEFKKFIHIKSGRIVEAEIEGESVYEKITLEKIQSEMSEYSERSKMLTNIEIVKKFTADPNYTFLRATSAEEFNNEHKLINNGTLLIDEPNDQNSVDPKFIKGFVNRINLYND